MKFLLPRLMLVTNRHLMQPDFGDALLDAAEVCRDDVHPAMIVQVREPGTTRKELYELAGVAKIHCRREVRSGQIWYPPAALCVINGSLEIARELGIGLHLPEREIGGLASVRQELGDSTLIGASTHSLDAARRAQDAGANYVVFGSVFPTASHEGSPAAGLEALREVAEQIEIPIFAIGGINASNAFECLQAGAHGVALMRAVWSTFDVAHAVRELLEVLDGSAQGLR